MDQLFTCHIHLEDGYFIRGPGLPQEGTVLRFPTKHQAEQACRLFAHVFDTGARAKALQIRRALYLEPRSLSR